MTTFEQVKKIVAEKLGVSEDKVTETAAFVNQTQWSPERPLPAPQFP